MWFKDDRGGRNAADFSTGLFSTFLRSCLIGSEERDSRVLRFRLWENMQQDQRRRTLKEKDFFTEYGDANRYKILEVIGKGSYGVVCAAIDTHTGEKVAIKKINDVFVHISDSVRILREIKLLRLLRHPDIVEIKRIMMPPSRREFKDIYVVLELMESDLHQVIKVNDDLTREHQQFFLYQLLRALKYMHTANVYHRDLKPKNILANSNCKLKICDFGLARVAFNDTPTTVFWTDYVATRWYRAPELCGSFFSKYTPAIDIWSIGCIFAEVLTGKPLFPGRSVSHQLELITDLLGSPTSDTISRVRHEKARKYLTEMKKKNPVPFSRKFPNGDPLAIRLLEMLLAFDPKDRPTAEEALADPYFKGLARVEREPSCPPISKLEFEFERRRQTKDDIRELIFREILEYHPQLLNDYINGSEGTTFVYPSAIGQFKQQFAHLEENGCRSGPVIPLERKHASLPRSSVHSSPTPPKQQAILPSWKDRRNTEELSRKDIGNRNTNTGTSSRLPSRMTTAKPGRVVGPVVQCENLQNIKGKEEARISAKNQALPQSRANSFFMNNNATNQEKHVTGTKINSQTLGIAIDINPNPYNQMSLAKANQVISRVVLDAKLLQTQSQLGAIGAATVAVASQRNVGTGNTQFVGMS